MMRILFIIFVLVPLLELYVLIAVGSDIGGLATIGLCLFTAAAGGLIIRWQGLQTLLHARQSMQQAQQHKLAEHGLHGMMLVLAGLLLFVPGFMTDTLGFLLLLPALRKRLMAGFIQSKRKAYTQPFETHTTKEKLRYDHVVDATIITDKEQHKK